MEKRTKLIPVRVDLICDQCGEVMEYSGMFTSDSPNIHLHKCKNGHGQDADKEYPRLEYEELTQYVHSKEVEK